MLQLWQNRLSYVGAAIAALALLFISSLLFFDLLATHPSPYLGLFTFLVLPAILVLGILLAVFGGSCWRAAARSGGAATPRTPSTSRGSTCRSRAIAAR